MNKSRFATHKTLRVLTDTDALRAPILGPRTPDPGTPGNIKAFWRGPPGPGPDTRIRISEVPPDQRFDRSDQYFLNHYAHSAFGLALREPLRGLRSAAFIIEVDTL